MTATMSAEERARVRDAVAAAEAKTSGEIYTVVAETNDDYRLVPLLWATVIALLVPLPLIFLTRMPASLIYTTQLAVFAALAAIFSHPKIAPRLVPARLRHGRARALAVQQFKAHGLHTTEARTGVLIFLSLSERHAEIIADAGIAAKVDANAWQEAMDQMLAEVREGRIADGLVAAVTSVGALLARHFPRKADDRNEPPDDLVLL